jgi:aminoglycoside phosphotransferase (APT) family kinase protein
MATPSADVTIDEALVAVLIGEQRPSLAGLPLEIAGSGWDNVMVRVGGGWAARLPRRAAAAELIVHEHRWLPVLAPSLPLAVPAPEFLGQPGHGYPYRWTLSRWLPGAPASAVAPANLYRAAAALTHFLNALHVPAPPDAPANPYRGVALAERAASVTDRLALLSHEVDADQCGHVWAALSAAPAWHGPPVWLHGDLHPTNILVHGGSLSAVIDWGDICSGDPATDLALLWMMFPPDARMIVRAGCSIDEHTWRRAAGWALNLALAYMTGDDSTSMPGIGRATLAAVLAEFGGV